MLFPTSEGAQGGCHGQRSGETSAPGSESPLEGAGMQFTEHRHLSAEWVADSPWMHQSTVLPVIFSSVLLSLR